MQISFGKTPNGVVEKKRCDVSVGEDTTPIGNVLVGEDTTPI
jgi:hypothetical protein